MAAGGAGRSALPAPAPGMLRAAIWALGLAAASLLWLAPAAVGAPPVNDHFADRESLSGSLLPIEVARSNVEATKESEEWLGDPFAAGHSVWFEWEAVDSGWVTVGACGEDFDTVLDIYTGAALGSLTRVISGNASAGPYVCGAGDVYTFWATAGVDYAIGVDGNGFYLPDWPEKPATEGEFALRIESTPPPPNDDFADATALPGKTSEEPDGARFHFAGTRGYNWGAEKESGEPDHDGDPGGASVWYRWTAPEGGSARIQTCCSGPETIGVYTGGSLGALSPAPAGDDGFAVSAGVTYRIAVDGEFDSGSGEARMGSFSLHVSMALPSRPGEAGWGHAPPPADAIPPRTTIVRRTLKPAKRRATFAFRSSEPGSRFRCKLDRRAFAPCRSPKTYKNLRAGRHVFRVAALDAAGNVDSTPATARFSVPARRHGKR